MLRVEGKIGVIFLNFWWVIGSKLHLTMDILSLSSKIWFRIWSLYHEWAAFWTKSQKNTEMVSREGAKTRRFFEQIHLISFLCELCGFA